MTFEDAVQVAGRFNDRLGERGEHALAVQSVDMYLCITVNDVVLWDNEDTTPECPGCEEVGQHDCAHDSLDAIEHFVATNLHDYARELLRLAEVPESSTALRATTGSGADGGGA